MGKLSTHVLDTTHGKPAAGMKIELFRIERKGRPCFGPSPATLKGKLDEALLEGDDLLSGMYELVFHVGDYFAHIGATPQRPRFWIV